MSSSWKKEMHQIVCLKAKDAADQLRRYRKSAVWLKHNKTGVKKKYKRTDVPMLLFKVPSAW